MISIPWFALLSLKVVVVVAAGALVASALRQRPARVRVLVLASALVGSLLLPVLAPIVPQLPVSMPGFFTPEAIPTGVTPATTPPAGWNRAAIEPPGTTIRIDPAVGSSATGPNGANRGRRPPIDPAAALALAWLTGSLALLARLGLGLAQVRRVVRSSEALDDRRWSAIRDRAARLVGCRRRVRLVLSPAIDVPATVGVLRPVVLIPARGRDWPEDRRFAVLLHELVHVRRFDWSLRLLVRVGRALYWFNPLIWWAVRRLELEQELACDESVLATGTAARAYIDHLVVIARSAVLHPAPALSAMAMARTPQLEERIMTLLHNTTHRRIGIVALVPLILSAAVIVSAVAAISPDGTGATAAETMAADHDARPAPAAAPAAAAEPATTQAPEASPAPRSDDDQTRAEAARQAAEYDRQVAEKRRQAEEIARRKAQLEALSSAERQQIKELARRVAESAKLKDVDLAKITKLQEAMKPYLKKIQAIQLDMAPYRAEMERLQEKLNGMQLHIEDGTLEDVQRQIDEQVRDQLASIEELTKSIQPHLEEIEAVSLQMEELQRAIEAATADIEVKGEDLEKLQAAVERQLEPQREKLERLAEEMSERRLADIDEEVPDPPDPPPPPDAGN